MKKLWASVSNAHRRIVRTGDRIGNSFEWFMRSAGTLLAAGFIAWIAGGASIHLGAPRFVAYGIGAVIMIFAIAGLFRPKKELPQGEKDHAGRTHDDDKPSDDYN